MAVATGIVSKYWTFNSVTWLPAAVVSYSGMICRHRSFEQTEPEGSRPALLAYPAEGQPSAAKQVNREHFTLHM